MTDEKLEQAKKAQWKIKTYEQAPTFIMCSPHQFIAVMAEYIDIDHYHAWLKEKIEGAKKEFEEL